MYGHRPYNNQRNYNPYQRNNGYQRQQPKKRSGCKYTTDKNGVPTITGWNVSRKRGFITFIAQPKKNGKGAGEIYQSPTTKREFQLWTVKVTFKDQMKETFETGLYYIDTGKLILIDWQLVANPKAPNGGYFGTNSNKRR